MPFAESAKVLRGFFPNLKTVLPNAAPPCRDIEGYVDPREPLRDEGPVEVRISKYELRMKNQSGIRHSAFDICLRSSSTTSTS